MADKMVTLKKDAGIVTVTVAGFAPMVVDTDALEPSIKLQSRVHGVGQKLVDAGALSRDTTNGQPATAAEKYAAIKEVYDRLTGAGGAAPAWDKPAGERAVGDGGAMTVKAIAEVTGKTLEQAEAHVAGKVAGMPGDAKKNRTAVLAAYRTNGKIADAIARMKAAAVPADLQATVEADLAGLMAG